MLIPRDDNVIFLNLDAMVLQFWQVFLYLRLIAFLHLLVFCFKLLLFTDYLAGELLYEDLQWAYLWSRLHLCLSLIAYLFDQIVKTDLEDVTVDL